MREIANWLVCVAMVLLLYVNWTSVGVDNEKKALIKIRNSQGSLIKSGVEQ
jgi:hypothetical protein